MLPTYAIQRYKYPFSLLVLTGPQTLSSSPCSHCQSISHLPSHIIRHTSISISNHFTMSQCVIIKPPGRGNPRGPAVFLAGSIEMGKAELWQETFTERLSDLPVTVFNPRRNDWNKEWKQDISFPSSKNRSTGKWTTLKKLMSLLLYFQPGTMSPISLLELGLHASSGKVIVCCPEGYWRLGNVQVVCSRFGIPILDSMDELINQTREKLIKCLEERAKTA